MKAKPINVALRIKIAQHKVKNPKISFVELMQLFNVSYEQARQSYLNYKAGKYDTGRRRKNIKVDDIMSEKSPDEIFESQYHVSLATLEKDKNIGALDRIASLEKLSKIRKINQSMRLERHMKTADADFICAIIRRYEPDADDERIIEIYKEEKAKLSNESENADKR